MRVWIAHAVLPVWSGDAGAIINVASVAGFVRGPEILSHCATNCWMNAFTEGLYPGVEKGSNRKIDSAIVGPGFTYTEFHDVMGIEQITIPKRLCR